LLTYQAGGIIGFLVKKEADFILLSDGFTQPAVLWRFKRPLVLQAKVFVEVSDGKLLTAIRVLCYQQVSPSKGFDKTGMVFITGPGQRFRPGQPLTVR
jgi:hypothetical protein